ncbi:MAG: sucB, partial [Gammaproteobacteria bacterium]|nr:sucB [Gammaproteobacteria bacterium]
MSVEVKVPAFPESISEGTIATWHKAKGDSVTEGETLVEIETDKVVMEVPATATGVLSGILKKEGDTVKSQEVIGAIEAGAAAAAKPAEAPKADEAAKPATAQAAPTAQDAGPSVRRALAEHDLNAQDIKGTGKDGRLTKQDVEKHLQAPGSAAMPAGARTEQRVPMSRLRATIAKRLVEVQSTAAILTTFNEVDMKAVMDLRAKYKDQFEKEQGVKLGFMSFFLKATVEALKKFPAVNASIDGNDIVYHGYYDVGVAVSSPRGLVVPVVKNVDQMSLADIEKAIKDYGNKAKEGKLAIEDMQGGTFT